MNAWCVEVVNKHSNFYCHVQSAQHIVGFYLFLLPSVSISHVLSSYSSFTGQHLDRLLGEALSDYP